MDVVTFILTIIGLILLGIVGYFVTNAAVEVKKITNYETISSLKTAHLYLTTASVITWTAVALSIIIIFLHYIGVFFGNPWWIRIILLLVFLLSLISGILSAIAAYNINITTEDNQGSYQSSIIAAVLGISGSLIFAVTLILSFYWKRKKTIPAQSDNEPIGNSETTSSDTVNTTKQSEKSKVDKISQTEPPQVAVEKIGKELGIKETSDVKGYQAAIYNILKANDKLNLSDAQAEKLAAAAPIVAGKFKDLSPQVKSLLKSNSPDLYNKFASAGPSVTKSVKNLSPWIEESLEEYGPTISSKSAMLIEKYGPQVAEYLTTLL